MNSNITLCNDMKQCYYSFLSFNFTVLFIGGLVTYVINKHLKKEHFIMIIIHSITNIVNIVSYNYNEKVQYFCQYFIYIGYIAQLYLIVNQIVRYITEHKFFISDISFEVHNIPLYIFLFIIISFPFNIFFNDEIVLTIQSILLTIIICICFFSIYHTLQDILQFLNEKTSSEEELQIINQNVTVLDIYKIYNTIKTSMFINFSIFIFNFTILLMKKVVVSNLSNIIDYSSFVLIEIIPLIHFITMSIIEYLFIERKEETIQEINQEEDKCEDEEIKIELSNKSKNI